MKVVYENATKHEKGLVVKLRFAQKTNFRVGKNGSTKQADSYHGVVKRGEKVYADEPVVSHASKTVEDDKKERGLRK